jgi:hypothetical protein
LSGDNWKPGCMGPQHICHSIGENFHTEFEIKSVLFRSTVIIVIFYHYNKKKIKRLGLMVFVIPRIWRFWRRPANGLSFRGLDDFWPILRIGNWGFKIETVPVGQFQWTLVLKLAQFLWDLDWDWEVASNPCSGPSQ